MLAHFIDEDDWDDDDDEMDYDPDQEDVEAILEMMRNTEMLEAMPSSMIKEMLGIFDPGDLPKDVHDALHREARRRHLKI